jgi:hypothetical protein
MKKKLFLVKVFILHKFDKFDRSFTSIFCQYAKFHTILWQNSTQFDLCIHPTLGFFVLRPFSIQATDLAAQVVVGSTV